MTMVERVARAIVEAQLTRQYVGELKNIGAGIVLDEVWPEFVSEARAAIEAMRDPTEDMAIAGLLSLHDESYDVWRSMIEVALQESPA